MKYPELLSELPIQLIIKPTSICNFSCEFCSAKNLNIPIHDKVPDTLREYLLKLRPNDVIITGGEPLVNPASYFQDLLDIMDSFGIEYSVQMTSNLMLWYENPEKYDWLMQHPNVRFVTSFQYGNKRHDEEVYTEARFRDLYAKYVARYGKDLMFLSVISEENEKFAVKTCELAKELGTQCKLNCQLPVGGAKEYYPRYKLLGLYLDVIKHGLREYEANLSEMISDHRCPFTRSGKYCSFNKIVYVDTEGNVVEGHCEEVLSSDGKFSVETGSLFDKCYMCDMFSLCNGCSINRQATNAIRDEHCEWMLAHRDELKFYGIL